MGGLRFGSVVFRKGAKTLRTVKPDMLQFMGPQTVRHDSVTEQQ